MKLSPHKLLKRARKQKFAVGSFNVDNLEIFKAITAAALAERSPVLIELSAGEVEYMGLAEIVGLVRAARLRGAEMYINLDHSPSTAASFAALKAGFEFIHCDGFQNKGMTKARNIANLKKLERGVHRAGRVLEGEDQYFQGSSTVHKEQLSAELVKQTYTVPDEAEEFVRKTKVDIFAVSIGNLHGLYSSLKHLNIPLLADIRRRLPNTYFSLHGGSGTKTADYRAAIKQGVVKININTEMRLAYRESLQRLLRESPNEYKSYNYLSEVTKAVQKVVEDKMRIFGSSGKTSVRS